MSFRIARAVASCNDRLIRNGKSLSLVFASSRPSIATFSTSNGGNHKDLVLTTINETNGVATLTMNHPPVNSLSLEMCQAISQSIRDVESSSKVQALVLSSSLPSILSAGLDIMEMHEPDGEHRLPQFWSSFQQVYLDLYGSRLACVAAIEGHAPAAGCMLTLCCDYRIMAASDADVKPTIGLNESKLGIVAPPWLAQMMIHTVGHRQAEKALALGTLYSPEEALAIGLVDEVVPKSEVLGRAQAEAATWAKIPPQARVASKTLTRKKQLDHLIATRDKDIHDFCSFIQEKGVQRNLTMYLEMLKKKRTK